MEKEIGLDLHFYFKVSSSEHTGGTALLSPVEQEQSYSDVRVVFRKRYTPIVFPETAVLCPEERSLSRLDSPVIM